MSDSLLEEIDAIQTDYLNLLKELEKIPKEELSLSMIDSINIFWFEKRNIVNLACEYLFKKKDTYCFTAATTFDIEANEQFSFFVLGDYHIFDDPLPEYLNTINIIPDKIFLNKMQLIISNTIKDNIKLIEEFKSNLYVLPLRHLSGVLSQNYNQLDEVAERLFCNFFTDIDDMNQYKKKIKTMEDVVQHLDSQSSSMILLFDGDNPLDDWISRLNNYKETNDNYDLKKFSDSEVFLLAVFSYLRQALAIIDMEERFNMIPFLRSYIPLHYYVLLSTSLEQNTMEYSLSIESNFKKSQIAYFVYQEYSKRNLSYSISEIKLKSQAVDFEAELYNKIGILGDSYEIDTIIEIIRDLLDDLIS